MVVDSACDVSARIFVTIDVLRGSFLKISASE